MANSTLKEIVRRDALRIIDLMAPALQVKRAVARDLVGKEITMHSPGGGRFTVVISLVNVGGSALCAFGELPSGRVLRVDLLNDDWSIAS